MGRNKYTYKKGYNGTLKERMAKKTIKGSKNDCWLWIGSLDTKGYACIRVDKKLRRASHVAFELHNDMPVPKGKIIMHSCDNPACVNPNHLSIGTKLLNSIDKINKGRGNWLKHDSHPMAKLSKLEVDEIRYIFSKGKHTYKSIASMFNINRTTASRIINYKSWK